MEGGRGSVNNIFSAKFRFITNFYEIKGWKHSVIFSEDI